MSQGTVFEIVQIIVAVIGGIGIASYWNWRNHKLSEYRYLDQVYWSLLQTYRDKPEFGDKRLTDNYRESYRDKDASSYHYFAMCAHTVMETIYDVYGPRIPPEWAHVYRYHTTLHAKWLRDNQSANRPDYVTHCLAAQS
jgi:hypothetical protein